MATATATDSIAQQPTRNCSSSQKFSQLAAASWMERNLGGSLDLGRRTISPNAPPKTACLKTTATAKLWAAKMDTRYLLYTRAAISYSKLVFQQFPCFFWNFMHNSPISRKEMAEKCLQDASGLLCSFYASFNVGSPICWYWWCVLLASTQNSTGLDFWCKLCTMALEVPTLMTSTIWKMMPTFFPAWGFSKWKFHVAGIQYMTFVLHAGNAPKVEPHKILLCCLIC